MATVFAGLSHNGGKPAGPGKRARKIESQDQGAHLTRLGRLLDPRREAGTRGMAAALKRATEPGL